MVVAAMVVAAAAKLNVQAARHQSSAALTGALAALRQHATRVQQLFSTATTPDPL
jgi:hypothetical protein